MKGIDKKACSQFLEPVTAPNSDCGLFLVRSLNYIVRTAIKLVGHRRLLILCLYARGDTPGGRPKLAYTVFQASDSFITCDHREGAKSVWRTAMLSNLERAMASSTISVRSTPRGMSSGYFAFAGPAFRKSSRGMVFRPSTRCSSRSEIKRRCGGGKPGSAKSGRV